MVLCSVSRFWQRETKTSAFFTAGIVRAGAGGLQGVEQELRVREIGPLALAVARPAVIRARLIVRLPLVPLDFLQELFGVFHDLRELLVLPVAIGRRKGHQPEAGFVILVKILRLVDSAVGLDELFQIFKRLRHHRIVRAAAVAQNARHDDGRHARPGLGRERTVRGLAFGR